MYDRADIVIGPAPREPIEVYGRLIICTPSGQHLAALPTRWISRVSGTRGVTVQGQDLSGVIDVVLRVAPTDKWFTLTITCTWSRPMLPGAVLPIVRFQRHATPPNTLSAVIDKLTTRPVTVPATIAVSQEAVQFVEDLDRLQAATGNPFPVPHRWTALDLSQARRAVELLDGRRISASYESLTMDAINPERIREAFQNPPNTLRMSNNEPYTVQVAGQELELGPYTVYIPNAQLHAIPTTDGAHKFKVLPGPGSNVEIALGGLPDSSETPVEPS